MNKYIKGICAVALSAVMISSCDMDRFPKSSIAQDKSLLSVSDAQKWDNGFAATFRSRQYGLFTVEQDRQADQLNATVDFGNRGGAFYIWTSLNSGDYSLRDVWKLYYRSLKNVNSFLEGVQKITPAESEKAELDQYIGNAHFYRAFYYFNLAIRYGRPYVAATAGTDLCVPLVLKYDPNELPVRATNEAVYKQILSDLDVAKKNLAGAKGVQMSTRVTLDACVALEARVKFFMSDWAGALSAANSIINSGTYALVAPNAESFKKMWHLDTSSEEILQMFVSRPDELPNTNNYYSPNTALGTNTPDWLPTQWMLDLYAEKDLRKSVYFEKRKTTYGGINYDLYIISKFKGNKAFAVVESDPIWGYLPNSVHKPKVFRLAEMYLIAMESAYNAGQQDEALKLLNTLKKSRGIDEVNLNGDALLKEIRDERTRELAFEGYRLWDLRRWNMPMERRNPQTVDGDSPFLSTVVEFKSMVVEAGHPKFVWGIPSNDMKTNVNLKGQQNPGW